MRLDIVDGRLAAWHDYSAREHMKAVPGARWDPKARAWTYPLSYPSAVSIGVLAAKLRVPIEPSPEALDWVQEQTEDWQALTAAGLAVSADKGTEGFYPHQVQCANWLSMASPRGRLDTSETGCLTGDTILTVNRGGKGFAFRLDEFVSRFLSQTPGGRNGGRRRDLYRWDSTIPTKIAYRADDGSIRSGVVRDAWVSGEKEVFEIITASGHRIKASATHPFLTADGWVEASRLSTGTEVYVNAGQGGRVRPTEITSITPCGVEMTYDIEMAEDPHNYIANGFVVHNSGKTRSALRAAWECWSRGETGILLVSTLVAVKAGWAEEVEAVAPLLPLPDGAAWQVFVVPNAGTMAKRAKVFESAQEASEAAGGVGVVLIVNHEQLRTHSRLSGYGDIALARCPACGGVREGEDVVSATKCHAHDKELNKLNYVAVTMDECFVPGALVDTPSGPREIGSLHEGDLVWGFNEETGKVEATAVKAVMRRKSAVVENFVTPGHPVRVSSGYYPVADLRESDHGFTLGGGDVPTLREDVLGAAVEHTPWAEVLFKGVFRGGSGVHSSGSGTLSSGARENKGAPGRAGEVDRTPVRTDEPLPGPRGTGAQARGRVRLSGSGREWSRTDGAAGAVAVGARGGMGRGAHGAGSGESPRGEVVFTGHRAPGEDGLRGGGWELTPGPEGEGAGRPEGRVLGLGRLDGSEVHESRDPDRAASVPVGDHPVDVVNIETGTSNYFVHGLLVHNCHRLMNPRAQTTRAGWSVCDSAPRVWGLTGTPGSRSVMENTWALLRLVNGKDWPSKSSWTAYFAHCGHNSLGIWEIGRLRAERADEFRVGYSGLTRRVLKAQVLNLPPLLRGGTLVHRIPMKGEQAKVYKDMEALLRFEVEEGEVTSANALAMVSRLCVLASGSGAPGPKYGQVERYDDEGNPVYNTKMEMRAPSNKVDYVVDMIAGDGLEPGTAFQAVHPDLLTMLRDALVKKKLIRTADEFGLIIGSASEAARTRARLDFQSGKIPFIGFTTGAGGTGITLTRASTMVALERPWSPIQWKQAQDRVHRIGSERHETVSIIDVITEDSVEDRQLVRFMENEDAMEDVLRDKERLAELLFG